MGGRFSDDYEVAFYGILGLFILAEGIEFYIRAVSRDLLNRTDNIFKEEAPLSR